MHLLHFIIKQSLCHNIILQHLIGNNFKKPQNNNNNPQMKAQKKANDADYTVKIVIVGDSGVGKTNILCRFCQGKFKQSYVSTVGVDFKNKVIQVDKTRVKLQIWDTAGQQRFKNINQTYFKGAMGIILAYSITDSQSFSNVQTWLKQINEHSQSDIIKFLVATKCDLVSQRKVQQSEGQRMANKYQMQFIEVSSKDGTNIDQLFKRLGGKVVEYVRSVQKNQKNGDQKRISLHKDDGDRGSGEGGCRC